RAQRAQAESRINECSQRLTRLTAQVAQFQQQLADLGEAPEAAAEIEIMREQAEETAAELAEVEAGTAEAEAALPEARNREKQAREAASQARLKSRQLETEVATLVKLLKPDDSAKWRPVIDDISVTPGYEIALGAALTDDLDAGIGPDAPVRWSYISGEGDPALPPGAQPLGTLVRAPQELSRRLSQIGVISREQGASLQPMLKPGQRLVSKEGDVWRWDGFIAAGDAPSAAAKRLEERNRLGQLEEQVAVFMAAAEEAEAGREAASEAVNRIQQDEKNLRDRWRQLNGQLSAIKDKLGTADRAVQQHFSKRTSLMETEGRLAAEREEAAASQAEAESVLASQAPIADLEARLQACQADTAAKRNAYAEAKSRADNVEREIRARQTRLEAIAAERQRWFSRDQNAGQQIATLQQRLEAVRVELAELKELPVKIEERRQKILNELSQAEEARRSAATRLAEAENTVRDQERTLRDAQKALSEAREERARIEARLDAAREKRGEQAQHIRDSFECAASELLATLELAPEAELPATEDVDQQIIKLKGERERLGGVNLRAEEEAEALGSEFDGMEKERAELEEAIAKLRTAIANLNKEGRKRLMDAFDTVNGHFQRLFKVLFGGGDAELQLIESDDPLESGLELLCRPPGKKAQVLTLLSGGEKALTALALIFAVFLTNPSPICVLDEVDAPLDDANVHRFCAMLEEMRKTTDTRFLVITHNPITMATMDRLFGVTMQERGVSQLVSVDLQTAERFREVV
ncbi:MAG: chromosome segregation protein SMC, partial [Hyphomicrobiales bacterium]|nr:chromosome segregation protein SMC [Hyphomicrobiales bacterium]